MDITVLGRVEQGGSSGRRQSSTKADRAVRAEQSGRSRPSESWRAVQKGQRNQAEQAGWKKPAEQAWRNGLGESCSVKQAGRSRHGGESRRVRLGE